MINSFGLNTKSPTPTVEVSQFNLYHCLLQRKMILNPAATVLDHQHLTVSLTELQLF